MQMPHRTGLECHYRPLKWIPVCSRWSPTDWLPNAAISLTRPLTLTREPFARDASTLCQHRHLAGAIVDLVELDRHQRQGPRAGDDAIDGDGPVLISTRVVLQLGDTRVASRQRASRQRGDESERCDETQHRSCH